MPVSECVQTDLNHAEGQISELPETTCDPGGVGRRRLVGDQRVLFSQVGDPLEVGNHSQRRHQSAMLLVAQVTAGDDQIGGSSGYCQFHRIHEIIPREHFIPRGLVALHEGLIRSRDRLPHQFAHVDNILVQFLNRLHRPLRFLSRPLSLCRHQNFVATPTAIWSRFGCVLPPLVVLRVYSTLRWVIGVIR